MPIRVANLRLPLDEPEAMLPGHLAKALGVPADDFAAWRILRKSLDARKKGSFAFVYTAEVTVADDESQIARLASKRQRDILVELHDEPVFQFPAPGNRPLEHRPVVVGSGPGGLVAAYFLAEQGYAPILLERGRAVRERIRDVSAFDCGGPFHAESNYLFGEGGAGTFSDGKLTCRTSGPETRRVLELFAACKGKPSIVYDYRPHLGSNRLPAVVKAIRRRIEALGGEVRFTTKVEDLDLSAGGVRGLMTSGGYIAADAVILAIGHSARDTMHMLVRRGVPIVQKPFQLGVRIEQPQEVVNRVKYGAQRLEAQLGAADYSVIAKGPNDLFSFCMCAGGYVIPSVSEEGYFCTNGMSLSNHDSPFANSGLVVTIPTTLFPGDDVMAGVRLQEQFEKKAFELGGGEYRCPIQTAADFLKGRQSPCEPPSSYPRGLVLADLAELMPPLVRDTLLRGLPLLDHRWQGRFLQSATLVAPEARGSSPIRMVRDNVTRQSPGIGGLYPVGEGAGYAGGIVSAAVDGLKTAAAIVARFYIRFKLHGRDIPTIIRCHCRASRIEAPCMAASHRGFVDASWIISIAQQGERDAALQVAFANLPADERAARIAQVHDLIAMGEIDAHGIFVARNGGAIRGVFVCVPMPGATALVSAPRGDVFASALPDSMRSSAPVEDALCGDRLIKAGLQWLRERGIKIAQAIVAPEDADALVPLASHAFVAAGPMLFFRHDLAAPPKMPSVSELRIEPIPRADADLFARTLERTYEGTLDFPELSNVRSVDEILKSYRANPLYRPEHWRLALIRGEPAGILMLTEIEPLGGWDLTYVGVVPEQRQKGVGRALFEAALHIVADAAGAHLDVAVDKRNLPAIQLYASRGFQLLGERRVCLSFLNPE